ncbi:DUF58 domain-containing protein [Oceanirhabdus seepicola]|uniref:DUF58 domain-containing protein n=1 Tax=Oceanirhabdus seepicola TaxID=2828781 RepID=A0A9J6P2L6_9CLOT|nr:DUF58 domain-containing protein [Oceanirhabdus seepicola]MCM1990438.1 DUF58 domain-containing protein [Oceanirhabdus seepicola]
MLTREMIKKIKHIEIRSSRMVEEIFSGEYHSGFKGKGMEFQDIREYYAGDDIRNIDWNVTARHNKAFVKQFCEERQLNMFLLIDMSKSNCFSNKKEIIAEISATLALSANKNKDKIGAMLFTDKIEKFIPSKNGKKHVLSIIEHILTLNPKSQNTDISCVLKHFIRTQKKRSIVFIISDFLDEGYDRELKILSSKHELVMVRVVDKGEERIPSGAIFTFEDLETGKTIVLDNIKNQYSQNNSLKMYKKNMIEIYTDEDYYKPLKQFFKRRDFK